MLTVTMYNITNILNCITFNCCFIKIIKYISLCCPFNCASNKVLYMYVSILEVGKHENVRGSKIVSFFFFCYICVSEYVRVCAWVCVWVYEWVTMYNITNVLNCITFNSCFIKIMEHISLCSLFNCASNKVLYMFVSILEVGEHENVRGSKIVSFFFCYIYVCEYVRVCVREYVY